MLLAYIYIYINLLEHSEITFRTSWEHIFVSWADGVVTESTSRGKLSHAKHLNLVQTPMSSFYEIKWYVFNTEEASLTPEQLLSFR